MYHLAKSLFIEVKKHAREAFPEECCGFILYDVDNDVEIVRRVENVATARHKADPETFSRDGSDGYIMDEKELLAVSEQVDAQDFELRCIYHSHPNGRAYFSKEDQARAKMFDEPIYPEAVYIVVGVDDNSITGMSGHLWNEERLEYEELRVVPT
ncbi:MAG: M67 family metallopeptidase [Candidatus Binatia bacterium]|nr:M67 family metallopeptidase [Candidatus Binatia bacterium]